MKEYENNTQFIRRRHSNTKSTDFSDVCDICCCVVAPRLVPPGSVILSTLDVMQDLTHLECV